MFIVIYRPHNTLNVETQHFGPFATFGDAYNFLCDLPALGPHTGPSDDGVLDGPGVKYVQELLPPAQA